MALSFNLCEFAIVSLFKVYKDLQSFFFNTGIYGIQLEYVF